MSLSRLLPFIPEPADTAKRGDASAMTKMTERFKGLAKSLDKTAARLGSMPTKCADPHEYIQTLVDLFDAAAFIEKWIDHYESSQARHPPPPPTRCRPPSAAYLLAPSWHLLPLHLHLTPPQTHLPGGRARTDPAEAPSHLALLVRGALRPSTLTRYAVFTPLPRVHLSLPDDHASHSPFREPTWIGGWQVVCAFVIHDLDGLVQRHMRKAAAGFAKLID